MTNCGRCGAVAGGEVCWYCPAALCDECWERPGHCGHPEAEAINERGRQVQQPVGHPDHAAGQP